MHVSTPPTLRISMLPAGEDTSAFKGDAVGVGEEGAVGLAFCKKYQPHQWRGRSRYGTSPTRQGLRQRGRELFV